MAKQVNARVLLKHDTTANWVAVEQKFCPLAGEMIIYDDYEPLWETNEDGSYVLDSEGHKVQKKAKDRFDNDILLWIPGIKIGTGSTWLCDLPFVQITPDLKEKMEF